MHYQPPAGEGKEALWVQWDLTSLQPSLTTSQNSRGWGVWGLLGAELQRPHKSHSQTESRTTFTITSSQWLLMGNLETNVFLN